MSQITCQECSEKCALWVLSFNTMSQEDFNLFEELPCDELKPITNL